MLVDAGADRGPFARDFDACVIGAGPAGVTLARRLAAQGYGVALMEGGGLDLEPHSQALYEGELVGLEYYPLEEARLRMFGGSSMHWGGRCYPLEEADFLPRPYAPLSGWPIRKQDLDPYAPETDDILDLTGSEASDLPLTQADERFRRVADYRYSAPTRFGDKYRDEIAASREIVCAVNANLVDMRLDDGHGTMTEARFRSYAPGDPGFAVRARVFALCCGGLENPRLLLACNGQLPAGIGNGNDLVGRFFSEHLQILLGPAYFERPIPAAEAEAEAFYVPTEAFLAEHEVLGFRLRVAPRIEPPLSLPTELVRSASCVAPFAERLSQAVLGRGVDCDRGGLSLYFAQGGGRQAVQAQVYVIAEQSLVRDSRVMLSDRRDPLGMPRIRFDWRIGEADYRLLETAAVELGAHHAEQGIGRIRLADWLLAEPKRLPGLGEGSRVGGHHHMCTTRMSADPREGVVDADCKVHGVSNLYVGGSSVFATGGYATPTYTIVQLALRLGDHLGGVLKG
jgi:choline dehydrogenase-like flavoprotein